MKIFLLYKYDNNNLSNCFVAPNAYTSTHYMHPGNLQSSCNSHSVTTLLLPNNYCTI